MCCVVVFVIDLVLLAHEYHEPLPTVITKIGRDGAGKSEWFFVGGARGPKDFDTQNVFRCFQFFKHACFVKGLLVTLFKTKTRFSLVLQLLWGGVPPGPRKGSFEN